MQYSFTTVIFQCSLLTLPNLIIYLVKVNDVHIRYEDDLSLDRPFACGLRLESLAARTSDSTFTPKFVHRETDQVNAFKLVALEGMSVYLDMDAELYGDLDTSDLEERMCVSDDASHSFILNPVSGTANVTRNCSERPLNSRKTPRVKCDVNLESIPLELSDKQYQCIVTGGKSLHQVSKQLQVIVA